MTPAASAPLARDTVETPTGSVLFEDVVREGATWSHVLKRGTALRITDSLGGANVGALFFNWENPAERYNMPDTLRRSTSRASRGASSSIPTWGASSARSPTTRWAGTIR